MPVVLEWSSHGAVTQCLRVALSMLAAALLTTARAEEGGPSKRGNPLWGVPLSELRATVERPLFSPSRHPPPPPLAVPTVAASPLPPPRPAEPDHPPLVLLGTVVGERDEIAVFLDDTTKDVVHLKVGQFRGGWTLRSVHNRQIDFEKDNRIATLTLARDAQEQRSGNQQTPAAASDNMDMESYRMALQRKRGR